MYFPLFATIALNTYLLLSALTSLTRSG